MAVAPADSSSSSSSFTSAATAHSPALAPVPPRPRLPLAALERVFSFLPLGPLLRLGRVDRRHYAGVQRAGSLGAAGAVLRLLDQRGGAALIGRVAHHAVLCHVRALQLGRFAADPLLGPAPRPPSPAPAPQPAQPSRLWLAVDGRPIDLGVLGDADPAVADGDEDDGDGLSRKWREGRSGTAAGNGRDGAALTAESALSHPPMDHQIDIFPAAAAAVSATSAGANADGSDDQSPPPHSHAHLAAAAQPLLLALSHGSLSPVSPEDGARADVTAIDADDSDDECDEAERAAIALERARIESHARAHLAESLALDVDLRRDSHGADQERMEPSRSRPRPRSRRPSHSHSHSQSHSHSPSRRSDGSLLRRGSGAFGSSRPPPPPPPQWHFSVAALAPLSFLPQLRSLALAFHPTDAAPLLMGPAAVGGGAEADPDADAEADAEAIVKAVVGEGGSSDAGPNELVLAFRSLAPLLRSLELRPAATAAHSSTSSSVAATAAASEIILPRLDAPLPSPSGGLESFRRQTAEGAAGRSELELQLQQSQSESQSQSQWQSARVCALLLSGASELAELERLDWTLPLPAAALFAPPPAAVHSAAATRSGSIAASTPDRPAFDLRRLAGCARLVHLHLRWPRADPIAADADHASASGSSPDSAAAAAAAAAAVLDAQLRELQIALPALRIVQTEA